MARFTPPTPRSRRLGRELRRLREARSLTQGDAAKLLRCSQQRIARIESGDIKPRPRDVLEILVAYDVPHDEEQGLALRAMAEQLREPGWWQRLNTLPARYVTFIAYEAEATDLRQFQPTLIPGLMQTRAYAQEVIRIGRETDQEEITQRVEARLKRQEVLTARKPPLRLQAIITEQALMLEVGDADVRHEQLAHIIKVAALPNVTVQVLTLAAGAHLAVHGGFEVLTFADGDPPLGYIETLAGELFLESPEEIRRLTGVHEHLLSLALSPRESIRFIQEKKDGIG
ncbi:MULTISPECIES: helix-turn-helix transcriptional regulator [Micromonospora]|nr:MULTISPECIES: helix-turn-helix transcriptional regulator [Micromonospora]NES17296.1 helix-turn-helix transcriptional regulator [Micromonospora sp. PPF5-17B]NES39668.1 helix-turn-helix transcriptional regulator [Micromonospora solifontis]NES59128.1 helix-turn-helix transcriptional regulator [Micromonospora sp. PPF5-6]